MLRDDGVALIKQQLAFRQTLDSVIVTQLQFAQTTLESLPLKPWFLIGSWETLVTVAESEDVSLPDDFLGEVEEYHVYWRPSDYPTRKDRKLIKADYDELKQAFDYPSGTDDEESLSESLGTDRSPRAYACMGNVLHVFPLPDAVYSIRGRFYEQEPLLTTNIENGWLKYVPKLILGEALKLISVGPLGNERAAGVADQWIAEGSETLRRLNEFHRQSNREDQIGGRHY